MLRCTITRSGSAWKGESSVDRTRIGTAGSRAGSTAAGVRRAARRARRAARRVIGTASPAAAGRGSPRQARFTSEKSAAAGGLARLPAGEATLIASEAHAAAKERLRV